MFKLIVLVLVATFVSATKPLQQIWPCPTPRPTTTKPTPPCPTPTPKPTPPCPTPTPKPTPPCPTPTPTPIPPIPPHPTPTPSPVFIGKACPFIWSRDCSLPPPVDPECFYVNFGECVMMPTQHFKFYERVLYDIYSKHITFQRYLDAQCQEEDPNWSYPAPGGYSGECIGPVALRGVNNYFLVITVANK